MSHLLYTPAEAQSRALFLALMWASSYPGRIYAQPVSDNPFVSIGMTLLDLETSYFTPQGDLALRLAETGARALPPERAAYHFYPTIDRAALKSVDQAFPGTMLYPDQAATLIVGCRFGEGSSLRLKGPGIRTETTIQVMGLPGEFWTLRGNFRFPMGWDVFLIDHENVIGILRSTTVTLEQGD